MGGAPHPIPTLVPSATPAAPDGIDFPNQQDYNFSEVTSGVITKPAWGQSDDDYWMVVCAIDDDGGIGSPTITGWTRFVTRITSTNRDRRVAAFYKKVNVATDPTSWTLNWGDTETCRAVLFRVTGADGSTFVDASEVANAYVNTSAPVSPDITTITDGAAVLRILGGNDDTNSEMSHPQGHTPLYDIDSTAISIPFLHVAYEIQASAGAAGTAAWAGNISSIDAFAISVAIRPTATTTTVQLDGKGDAASAGAGDMENTVAVAGDGANSSDGTGDLELTSALDGEGAAASDGSGDLTGDVPMAGAGAAASAGSGTVSGITNIAGDGPAASAGGGALGVTVALDGEGAAANAGDGDLSVTAAAGFDTGWGIPIA